MGNADDRRGDRAHQSFGTKKEVPGRASIRGEGPAVHGVEADSHASEHGRNAAEDADLRAVYVHDIRPDPPAEANQLNECQQVLPWVDLPSEVVERYERNPGFLRRFAQQPRSMSSD